MAGCKGAKRILAINTDPEAPILASADYAVIGDMHEIVPAISAELRRDGAGACGSMPTSREHASPRSCWSPLGRRRRRCSPAARTCSTGSSGSGKPVERTASVPRRVRNETTIVLGQRKLLQRLVPGPRPRPDLLGLRRPLPDDRHGVARRGRPSGLPRPARGSAARAGSSSSSTCSACSCWSAWPPRS